MFGLEIGFDKPRYLVLLALLSVLCLLSFYGDGAFAQVSDALVEEDDKFAVQNGTLRGRFVFGGEPPTQFAADLLLNGVPIFDESLVVSERRGIANVVVYLREQNVPVARRIEQPAPAILTVKMLRADPHALAMSTAQSLVIRNEDSVGVNVKIATFRNSPMNVLLHPGAQREFQFEQAEPLPIQITDNIHPWLSAYLLIHHNPYFAVSAKDGTFVINDLPPGEWEFQFWHEQAGYLERDGEWTRGRVKLEISPGVNDLGVVKLAPTEFGLEEQQQSDAVQTEIDRSDIGGINKLRPGQRISRRVLARYWLRLHCWR